MYTTDDQEINMLLFFISPSLDPSLSFESQHKRNKQISYVSTIQVGNIVCLRTSLFTSLKTFRKKNVVSDLKKEKNINLLRAASITVIMLLFDCIFILCCELYLLIIYHLK